MSASEAQPARPGVSVVIPVLNSERFIGRALTSLAGQTRPDFEVWVVDAGSTDRTAEIARGFGPRVNWLELPGSDMGAARNFGMRHSRGEYLMFLDSDDVYLPTKLESQVNFLGAHPEFQIVACAAMHFRSSRPGRMGLKPSPAGPVGLGWLLAGNNENVNTLCLRREVWDLGFRFKEGSAGRYGEEWSFQISLVLGGLRFARQPDRLVAIDWRADSHTNWERQWQMKDRALEEVEGVIRGLPAAGAAEINANHLLDRIRTRQLVAYLIADKTGEAREIIRKIRDPRLAGRLLGIWNTLRVFPAAPRSRLLRLAWAWYQQFGYTWVPADPAQAQLFRTP